MMRSIIVIMVVLSLIMLGVFIGCGGEDPVKPEKEPSEPEEPPPPPPPPPQGGGSFGSLLLSAPALTLERIARDVLEGQYGPELQSLLADEVSTCINQMSEEDVVSIASVASQPRISVIDSGRGQVLFKSGYIIPDILSGEYGREAGVALHYFIRTAPGVVY